MTVFRFDSRRHNIGSPSCNVALPQRKENHFTQTGHPSDYSEHCLVLSYKNGVRIYASCVLDVIFESNVYLLDYQFMSTITFVSLRI